MRLVFFSEKTLEISFLPCEGTAARRPLTSQGRGCVSRLSGAGTRHQTPTIAKQTALIWLMVLEDSIHGWLAPKKKYDGKAWQNNAA